MILLYDKIILYLFSFIYLHYLEISAQTIVLFLLSVASTSFMNAYTYEKYKTVFIMILLFNLFLSCFVPEYILFLPIILYDCVSQLPKQYLTLFLIPIINMMIKKDQYAIGIRELYRDTDILFLLFSLFVLQSIISFSLAVKTQIILKNKKDINTLQDTYNEHKINLEHENENLLKQQDYEINIATLNERNRIAREIHDNVGHMLSRSILQVGALIAVNKNEALNEPYQNLKETLDQAMNSIRNSVHNLHNESIDLENNIKQLIAEFDFCNIELDYDISKYIPKEVKYCFISITKEALNNAMKHSNATKITISIVEHPSFYKYVFCDNGTSPLTNSGHSSEKIEEYISYKEGIGLSNMRERIKTLNGIINFSMEKGFCINISIPKKLP